MDGNGRQPHGRNLMEGDGSGDFSVAGSQTSEFLPELSQLLCGDATVFGLEAFSMLPALMFDHRKIRPRLRAIQTLAHFRQNEAAGGADLSDGNHDFMTGWSNVRTESRADRGRLSGRALLAEIIRQEAGGAVEIGQGRGGHWGRQH